MFHAVDGKPPAFILCGTVVRTALKPRQNPSSLFGEIEFPDWSQIIIGGTKVFLGGVEDSYGDFLSKTHGNWRALSPSQVYPRINRRNFSLRIR